MEAGFKVWKLGGFSGEGDERDRLRCNEIEEKRGEGELREMREFTWRSTNTSYQKNGQHKDDITTLSKLQSHERALHDRKKA